MERYRVAIATVGCRSNQADSGELARLLNRELVEITEEFAEANLAVVNTCCVTAEAERDCRKLARRALGAAPDVRVFLWGCAVSTADDFGAIGDDRVERLGGIENPPSELAKRINEMAREAVRSQAAVESWAGARQRADTRSAPTTFGRTRALLKIQNGCSHFCAYCIVPFARGKERSTPEDEVLAGAARLCSEGYNEVVLTGVQLGAWGSDLPGRPQLSDLVVKVADALGGGRLRLSSIEPWSVDDALIDAVAGHERICPHFHVPLQNGDDGVLAAMRRGYTSREYIELVDRIRKKIEDVCIGADMLLGFPGEDDAAFENTMRVLEEIRPAHLHAFTYSPRPGTKAAKMPDRPKRDEAKKRTIAVRELAEKLALEFRAGQAGKIREIIVEEKRKSFATGLTDNFIPVRLDPNAASPGELAMVRLEPPRSGENRLRAVVI